MRLGCAVDGVTHVHVAISSPSMRTTADGWSAHITSANDSALLSATNAGIACSQSRDTLDTFVSCPVAKTQHCMTCNVNKRDVMSTHVTLPAHVASARRQPCRIRYQRHPSGSRVLTTAPKLSVGLAEDCRTQWRGAPASTKAVARADRRCCDSTSSHTDICANLIPFYRFDH